MGDHVDVTAGTFKYECKGTGEQRGLGELPCKWGRLMPGLWGVVPANELGMSLVGKSGQMAVCIYKIQEKVIISEWSAKKPSSRLSRDWVDVVN